MKELDPHTLREVADMVDQAFEATRKVLGTLAAALRGEASQQEENNDKD